MDRVNSAFAMGAGLQVRCVKPQEKTEGVRWFPPPPPAGSHGAERPPAVTVITVPAESLPSPLRGEEMRPCDSKRLQAGGIMQGQSGKEKKKENPPKANNNDNPTDILGLLQLIEVIQWKPKLA